MARTTRFEGSIWLATLLLASGCNAILGVKDVKPARDAGVDTAAADGGGQDAGTSEGSGGAGEGGHAGRANAGAGGHVVEGGRGGHPAAGNGEPNAGSGGEPHAGTGGGGGEGGSPAGSDTVHGKVIDYFRHPIPDVIVQIGNDNATTDASGAFSIPGVSATYDATLTINTSTNNSPALIIWQVQGLTRRDPVLQVYRGLSSRFGEMLMHVTNVTFPLPDTQKIVMGWSGPDGNFSDELDAADTDDLSPRWSGPAMTQGTAHALLYSFSGAQNLPTDYLAHDVHPVAMSESDKGEVTFDLGGQKPTVGTVSGNVAGSTGNTRSNEVYVRFTDATALQVASDDAASTNFSYIVPNLSNAVIDVVAKNSNDNGGYAAALIDDVAPGQSALSLTIPNVPTLSAPPDGKNAVDTTTLFQWTSEKKVVLFCANSRATYDALCVVTAGKQTHLPAAPPTAGDTYDWTIETHGDYATADDASAPGGFLSSYAVGSLRGPKRGASSYAESASRSFVSPN